jgi:hypothetical protein
VNVETFLIKERLFNKLMEMTSKVNSNEKTFTKDNSAYVSSNKFEEDDLFFLDKNDNDFKDLSEYYFIINENKKYNFFLEEYEKIIELKAGFSFGDYALESTNRLRTATIRMESDCYFAVIKQEDYSNYLLNEKKNSKMKEFKFLYEGFFYKNLDKEKFQKFYFSEFIYEEYRIGHILELETNQSENFENNEKRINLNLNNNNNNNNNYVTSLYLIKEGQVEISLNKNLNELFNVIKMLINCHSTFNSILDVAAYAHYLTKKLKTHAKELSKKRNLSIMKIGVNDILGVEEFYFKIPFLFQAKVVSEKLCLYKLTQDGFNKIINRGRVSNKFMKEHVLIKMSNKITRLVNLNKTFLRLIDNEIQEKKINLEKKLKRDKMNKNNIDDDEFGFKENANKKEINYKSRNKNVSLYDKTSSIQKNINNIISSSPGMFCILNSSLDINENFNFNCIGGKSGNGIYHNGDANLSNHYKEHIKFSKFKKSDLFNILGMNSYRGININKINKCEPVDAFKIIDSIENSSFINSNIASYRDQNKKNKYIGEMENSPTNTLSIKKSYDLRKSINSNSFINSSENLDKEINPQTENFYFSEKNENLNYNKAVNFETKFNNQSTQSLKKIKLEETKKNNSLKLLPSLVNNDCNCDINNQNENEKDLNTEINLNRKKNIAIENSLFNKFSKIEQILNVPIKPTLNDKPNKLKNGIIDFDFANYKNKSSGKTNSNTNLKLGLNNVFKKLGENEQPDQQPKIHFDNKIFKIDSENKIFTNKNAKENYLTQNQNDSVSFSEDSTENVNEEVKNNKENLEKAEYNLRSIPEKYFSFKNKKIEENNFSNIEKLKETSIISDDLRYKNDKNPIKRRNSQALNISNVNQSYNLNSLNYPNLNLNKARKINQDFFNNNIINLKTNGMKPSFDNKTSTVNPNNKNINNSKFYENNLNEEIIEGNANDSNRFIMKNNTLDSSKTNDPNKYNVSFNLYLNLNLNTNDPENQIEKQSNIKNNFYKGSKSPSKKINIENDSKRLKNINKPIRKTLTMQSDNLEKIINEYKFKNKKVADYSQENTNILSNRTDNNMNSERSSHNAYMAQPIQKQIENFTNCKLIFNDQMTSLNNKQNNFHFENHSDNKYKSNSEQKNYLHNNNNLNISNGMHTSRNAYYNCNINDSGNSIENYSARNYACENNQSNRKRNNSNQLNAFELKSYDFDNVMQSLPKIKNPNSQYENETQRNVFIPRKNANISMMKYLKKKINK